MSTALIAMQVLQVARLALAVGDTTAQLVERLQDAYDKNQGIDVVKLYYKNRLDDMIIEGDKLAGQ